MFFHLNDKKQQIIWNIFNLNHPRKLKKLLKFEPNRFSSFEEKRKQMNIHGQLNILSKVALRYNYCLKLTDCFCNISAIVCSYCSPSSAIFLRCSSFKFFNTTFWSSFGVVCKTCVMRTLLVLVEYMSKISIIVDLSMIYWYFAES